MLYTLNADHGSRLWFEPLKKKKNLSWALMGKAYIIKFTFVIRGLLSDSAEFKHLLKTKTVFSSYAFLILGNQGGLSSTN